MRGNQIIDWFRDRSLATVIVLGQSQNALSVAATFREAFDCKVFLVSRGENPPGLPPVPGVNVRAQSHLSREYLINLDSGIRWDAALLVSVGARWIVGEEVLELFDGRAINFHPGILPANRGASAASWAIMNQNSPVGVSLHVLEAGIDSGEVIVEKLISGLPPGFSMNDVHEEISLATIELLNQFISCLHGLEDLPVLRRASRPSYYFPPLSAGTNGWIDWSWHGLDIETFVKAFSRPYEGASTLHQGARLRVLDARFNPTDEGLHPFTHGLVLARNSGALTVAALGGEVLIAPEDLVGESVDSLRAGDRLHTPKERIEQAREFRRKNL